VSYKIRGINELYLTLKANYNNVKLTGNWDAPSFEGNFLPVERKVENGAFVARWEVPKIATSSISKPEVGVSLLLPVDNYRMTERALKYAFLFLSLTFISYFVFELVAREKRKIHPLQYCMLGGAMLVFYLLLLSMSEFLPFNVAYFIAASMIISLIGLYTYHVLTKGNGLKFSILITFLLALLYLFLYVLLMLQDFSLLIGSIAMFVIIAAIMYVTRNVEWYGE